MSVDTNTTPGREHIESPRVPKSVPVARVIAGSLIAGAVTALVLVLVVFPGATESVITGSALLAFGLGWAMMRVLSARMTTPTPAVDHRPRGRDDRHRCRRSWSSPRRTRPSPRSTGCGLRRCWPWPAGCSSRCAAP